MVVFKNITELVRVEYTNSIDKLSDLMIASTSHDMKTPLNTIISMHTLIQDSKDVSNIVKWIKLAQTSTYFLLYLVNDTLDYYLIKTQKFSLNLTSFCLKKMI